MKVVELDLITGSQVTIFFNTNIAIHYNAEGQVIVMDGRHNNGGWKVKGSYDEVINKFLNAYK
jgi:hypothetical protein